MGKKLNKTLYKGQAVEMAKEECSLEEPCLVWLAWDVRNESLVLECPPLPQLDTSIPTPSFEVTRSVPVNERRPSAYLQDGKWVDALKATVKGVTSINVEERGHLRESNGRWSSDLICIWPPGCTRVNTVTRQGTLSVTTSHEWPQQ